MTVKTSYCPGKIARRIYISSFIHSKLRIPRQRHHRSSIFVTYTTETSGVSMLGATPLSTGYDAHAVAKHQLSMAEAANAAVDLDLSFDDEMVEDVNANFSQRVPKGTVFGGYGKSSGKANVGRNANVSQMSSSTERHRPCPLGGTDRNKSPEPTITYTYDFSKPIEYDPIHLNTYNSDREGQTSQMLPHPSPNIPNATSTGDSRPHIGDSPPRDDAERDKIYHATWRQVFCEYADVRNREIIEKAIEALAIATHNIEEAAAEREYLIRNQAHLEKQALLGSN